MSTKLLNIEVIGEGWVSQRQPDTPTAVAAGSRCALTSSGDLVCTYMLQSELGKNDFVPTLSRSSDGGETWQQQGAIWPHLKGIFSIFCAVSRAPSGELFMFGTRTPIDQPGESFWSEATQGIKQNELIWAKSADGGRAWSEPTVIPMPLPGSAEAPGTMCITGAGRWVACYSPYNTFDPAVVVKRNHVVAVFSDDQGQSWRHASMLNFESSDSGGAESWVIELADGRLLGTSWHMNHRDGSDYPNPFSLSSDGGKTWQPTLSTGIQGQSTALAPLPDGRALFIYNQRKHGEVGVWLAVANPSASDFGIETNQIVWRAATATQKASSAEHSEWQDFAFGEPSVTVLADSTLLVTLWCIQPHGRGILYVKLKMMTGPTKHR